MADLGYHHYTAVGKESVEVVREEGWRRRGRRWEGGGRGFAAVMCWKLSAVVFVKVFMIWIQHWAVVIYCLFTWRPECLAADTSSFIADQM